MTWVDGKEARKEGVESEQGHDYCGLGLIGQYRALVSTMCQFSKLKAFVAFFFFIL